MTNRICVVVVRAHTQLEGPEKGAVLFAQRKLLPEHLLFLAFVLEMRVEKLVEHIRFFSATQTLHFRCVTSRERECKLTEFWYVF